MKLSFISMQLFFISFASLLFLGCSKEEEVDLCDQELTQCLKNFIKHVEDLPRAGEGRIDLIITKKGEMGLLYIGDEIVYPECEFTFESDCPIYRRGTNCGWIYYSEDFRGSKTCGTIWERE